jgi:hypothetical protein
MVEFAQVRVRENTCPGAGTRVPFGRMKDVKRSGGKRSNGGTTALQGARRIMIPGGDPVVRVTGAPAELSELAAEFPGYEFSTQQTWGGISITARRHGGGARPGLYAVVTNDADEMRRALLEQERPS